MASAIDIANFALTKLGEARVISFADDNKQGRALTALYDKIRDDELRRHLWNFAIKRVKLPADADAPEWGYERQYTLPADCLRVVQVNDFTVSQNLNDYRSDAAQVFQIEGRKILTDYAAPLKVRYLWRVTDTTQYDACFVAAFSARLAFELAEELTSSASKKEAASREYKEAVREAKRIDAIENPPQVPVDDSWLMARL